MHVGLRTILARCLPLPLSSSKEDDNNNDKGEEGEEAQELDIGLD